MALAFFQLHGAGLRDRFFYQDVVGPYKAEIGSKKRAGKERKMAGQDKKAKGGDFRSSQNRERLAKDIRYRGGRCESQGLSKRNLLSWIFRYGFHASGDGEKAGTGSQSDVYTHFSRDRRYSFEK